VASAHWHTPTVLDCRTRDTSVQNVGNRGARPNCLEWHRGGAMSGRPTTMAGEMRPMGLCIRAWYLGRHRGQWGGDACDEQ
jgi:hypothetical protein